MLQHSDVKSIDSWLKMVQPSCITIKQIRLACGLPKRVKDAHVKKHLAENHPAIQVVG